MCIPRDTRVFAIERWRWRGLPPPSPWHQLCRKLPPEGSRMRELSHPLMGKKLLCRADDHPRQPPPHAACCCFAGRDRLAAGVRCSWRSRLGVVSCLTRPSSGVQWPVPPPSEEGVEVQPRNASEVGKVWRRPAFCRRLPSALCYSLSHLHTCSSPPQGGQLLPCR